MTAEPGQPDLPIKRKTYIPLENNPLVFTHLLHNLGVTPTLGFYDVHSISTPDDPTPIPRPAYALIFICPAAVYARARTTENDAMPPYSGSGGNEPVIWFRQTIRHACGLIGCLHAVSNGGARAYIQPDGVLDKFLKEAVPLKQTERAQLLYDSEPIEAAHASAAQLGDTKPPPRDEENGFHFITFVKGDDGHLWELNGGMKGPVDRGVLSEGEDALSEKALALGVKTFLGKDVMGDGDYGFSLVALAPKLDD
ncbi:hypothetical protein N7G274_005086 [Stereocaulon virgatum]|uniref:Ubiquitin carboxyl-terminal hydrolase n=1 Tax=Stereocaulon virgatum TaxID=373712 RepID=A0ABR4AB04_9LECA